MQTTITFTGTPAEIRRVVDLLAHLTDQAPKEGAEELRAHYEDATEPGSRQKGDLTSFVSLLSDSALDLLQILMEGGDDDEYTARELGTLIARDVNDVYGILGGIGRAWKKTSDAPNPFGSRWSWRKKAPTWWLGGSIVEELENALNELHVDRSSADAAPN